MDDKIKEYRTKHKECKWCKYCHEIIPFIKECPPYYKCILKDKTFPITSFPTFCKYY